MEPNWKHKTVFTGDNLYVMRGMNSGSVDLIYLDPPFNSNRAYAAPIGSKAAGAAFKDTWTLSDVDLVEHNRLKEENVGLYTLMESAKHLHSKGMFSYLVMMAVRLVEMRRLLKDTGSIYLHCDPTAGHYLKLVMDAVFGQVNFRNEVIWKRATSRKIDAKRFGNVHDTILFFSKTSNYCWNTIYLNYNSTYLDKMYRHNDKDGRGPYRLSDLTQAGLRSGESGMPWRGISISDRNKHWITPTGKGLGDWIVDNVIPSFREIKGTLARLDALDENNLIYWPKGGKGMPCLKRYLSSVKGPAATDIIENVGPVQGSSKEKTGYPTQKPLKLLERIIKASSNRGDVVLDPFCGCATTMVVAEDLGRNWVGIDISPKAVELVRSRIEDRQGLFRDITHREDVPRRTDMGDELKGKGKDEYRKTLYGLQDGNCNGCHVHFQTAFLEMDHITPRAKGGTDHAENFQLLCRPCNSLKGAKSQPEFKVLLAEKKGISTSWI